MQHNISRHRKSSTDFISPPQADDDARQGENGLGKLSRGIDVGFLSSPAT